jgi:tRNA (Thr-GGU) A37 N-methylase
LAGLDAFSHEEIIFVFDKVAPDRLRKALATRKN